MLLWFMMNVALPLLPIAIIGIFSWMLQWQSRVLDILSDGQLYFFSASVCGVFTFDAIKSDGLEPLQYSIIFIASLVLMSFYTVSMFITHSGKYANSDPSNNWKNSQESRRLTLTSVMATVFVVSAVIYARSSLGLF